MYPYRSLCEKSESIVATLVGRWSNCLLPSSCPFRSMSPLVSQPNPPTENPHSLLPRADPPPRRTTPCSPNIVHHTPWATKQNIAHIIPSGTHPPSPQPRSTEKLPPRKGFPAKAIANTSAPTQSSPNPSHLQPPNLTAQSPPTSSPTPPATGPPSPAPPPRPHTPGP